MMGTSFGALPGSAALQQPLRLCVKVESVSLDS
jgi:hypothetical protein